MFVKNHRIRALLSANVLLAAGATGLCFAQLNSATEPDAVQVLQLSEMGNLIGGIANRKCGPVTCTGQAGAANCPVATSCQVDPIDGNWCRTSVLNNFEDCNVVANGWSCTATDTGIMCGVIWEVQRGIGSCGTGTNICAATVRRCGESIITCGANGPE
jgi:hypothetical protein